MHPDSSFGELGLRELKIGFPGLNGKVMIVYFVLSVRENAVAVRFGLKLNYVEAQSNAYNIEIFFRFLVFVQSSLKREKAN